MNVLYLLSMDRTAGLVFWAAAVQVGAFYMQRWHYETLTEWGTETPGPKWLALIARAMGWAAYLTSLYILHRVGFVPAIVALIAMFFAPVAISTLDVWLVRSPTKPMALVSASLTVVGFAMMLRATIYLV